jgi:hypothetical protein
MFSLDAHSEFWEAPCAAQSFPVFVPDSTARHWRALLFLGFVSPQKLIDGAPNQSVRAGSLTQDLAKFNEIAASRSCAWGFRGGNE